MVKSFKMLHSHQPNLKMIECFMKEENVLELRAPVRICGDLHGQFYDLMDYLDKYPFDETSFLFLGDYVDRGAFSCEVILYLFLLKTKVNLFKRKQILLLNTFIVSKTSLFITRQS